jgi:transcription antitermination factor NusG
MIVENKKENITFWYLLYTNPRAEKKVALELQKKGFEVFLPLQRTLKVWSDRKKWVEEPLFKSYLFINTELERNYYQILNTTGIVKFVSFQGSPAKVDQREITLVKLLLGNITDLNLMDEPNDRSLGFDRLSHRVTKCVPGELVTITAGPLIGTQGKLISTRSGDRVLIELETMQQNLLITIPSNFLIKTHQAPSMAV